MDPSNPRTSGGILVGPSNPQGSKMCTTHTLLRLLSIYMTENFPINIFVLTFSPFQNHPTKKNRIFVIFHDKIGHTRPCTQLFFITIVYVHVKDSLFPHTSSLIRGSMNYDLFGPRSSILVTSCIEIHHQN